MKIYDKAGNEIAADGTIIKKAAAPVLPKAPPAKVEIDEKAMRAKYVNTCQDIRALGKQCKMGDAEIEKSIIDGVTLEQFRGVAIAHMTKAAPNSPAVSLPGGEIGLTKPELKQYSFMNVMRALAHQRGFINYPQAIKEAAFELDCSNAAAQIRGTEAKGIIIPSDVLKRTLSAETATDGAELVGTNLMSGSFIDVLRKKSIIMSLGARILNDLVGNIAIPRKTTGASAAWITAEGGDAGNSEVQFDQVAMSPKTLGAYSELTRQLLMQSSLDIEQLVRDDLASAFASAIDIAAFYGTGANGQPRGIANQTGINTPANFAAAVPTWAEVVAMESAVAADDADVGSLAYAFNTTMRGSMKTTEKASNTAQFIWERGNTVNGNNVGVSNNITAGDMFYGNWADMFVGFWSGLDILLDPYTKSLAGSIRVVAHESLDIAVRHPVSFAHNNDGV